VFAATYSRVGAQDLLGGNQPVNAEGIRRMRERKTLHQRQNNITTAQHDDRANRDIKDHFVHRWILRLKNAARYRCLCGCNNFPSLVLIFIFLVSIIQM
jgi:hypothetical protein